MATAKKLSSIPEALDWDVYLGDRNREKFTLPGDDGPIDITGAVVTAQARVRAPDPAVAATALITEIDFAQGEFYCEWDGEQLRTLLAGAETASFVWDLQVLEVGETLPRTLYRGALNVFHDVTRAAAAGRREGEE